MQPAKREFEKVPTGKLLPATIVDIKHDPKRLKKIKNKETGVWEDQERDCIQFIYKIDGLRFLHRGAWLTFSYAEKSTLYSKYLTSLVEGARPDMDFEIELLKGMRVNMLWKDNPKNPDFQNVEAIVPATDKIKPGSKPLIENDAIEPTEEGDDVPF